jgi:starch phosphorylase
MSQVQVPTPKKESDPHQFVELSPDSLYEKCWAVAHNLWWSWHPDVVNLFRDLDPIRWRQVDHNPIALLKEFTPEKLADRATETQSIPPAY